MRRCIELAKNGLGTTYPNPLVGSVIVHNEKVIGEGWHYKAGTPHAEVHAIRSVTDKSILKEATIYVSLEPCSHYGKTPPCADLIISSGIKKVIIGSTDPNPKVMGNGIQILRDAGCEVITDVLQGPCVDLNKRFFTFQQKKRPYIFLKWAQSTDGFIAPYAKKERLPVWITSEVTRQRVHKMRSEEQSILIGTQTALDDNPSLTTRDWNGNSPIRLVIDRRLTISKEANIYDDSAPTIIITEMTKKDHKNISYVNIDFSDCVPSQVCDVLYHQGIQSIIVEGGATTLQHFIDVHLWDEAHIYQGITTFGDGIKAPLLIGELLPIISIQNDMLSIYKNKNI